MIKYNESINETIDELYNHIEFNKTIEGHELGSKDSKSSTFIHQNKYLYLRYLNRVAKKNTTEYILPRSTPSILLSIDYRNRNGGNDILDALAYNVILNKPLDEINNVYDKDLVLAYIKAGGDFSCLSNLYITKLERPDYTVLPSLIDEILNGPEKINNEIIFNLFITSHSPRTSPDIIKELLINNDNETYRYTPNDYLILKLLIAGYSYPYFSDTTLIENSLYYICSELNRIPFYFDNINKIKTLIDAKTYLNTLKNDSNYSEWSCYEQIVL